jgi:hypothetical protein
MKKFHELTEQEILDLTADQINYYIDYDCADQGIGLLPPMPNKPELNISEPDETVYQIGDIICLHAEQAQRIMETINQSALVRTDYNYPDSSRVRITERMEKDNYYYPKMTPKDVYSQSLWLVVKDQAEAHNKALRRYNEDTSEYDKAVSGRKRVVEAIQEHIDNTREHAQGREQLRAEFKRYLELAEGRVSIALNFLLKTRTLKAYPDLMDEWIGMKDRQDTTYGVAPHNEDEDIKI